MAPSELATFGCSTRPEPELEESKKVPAASGLRYPGDVTKIALHTKENATDFVFDLDDVH